MAEWEKGMQRDATGIKQYGLEGPGAWRMRMVPSKVPGELQLSDEHLQPGARGIPIAFDTETGVPRIDAPVPMADRMAPDGDVVVKMAKLKAWALSRHWRDRYMYWVFDWSWADLTERRPAVVPFNPDMDAAHARYAKVCIAHELKLKRKWARASKRVPYAGGGCK